MANRELKFSKLFKKSGDVFQLDFENVESGEKFICKIEGEDLFRAVADEMKRERESLTKDLP